MNLWWLRNKLSKVLNLPFLAGRHTELSFSDTKEKLILASKINKNTINKYKKNKLIFLHIPKTAGSTVNRILECISRNQNTIYLKTIVRNYKPAILITKDWLGAWNTTMEVKDKKFSDANIISGHFPFGVHRFNKDKEKYNYFTVLRDPVQREISSFNYLYQTGGIDSNEVFSDFVIHLLDNPQVRMLAGTSHMSGVCDEKTYEQALENLKKHFVLFGPSEKTDEILSSLLGIYEWPSIIYYRENITKKKLVKNLDQSVNDFLLKKHNYDAKLYEFSKKHWMEWKETNQISDKKLNDNDKVLKIDRNYKDNKKIEILSYKQINK